MPLEDTLLVEAQVRPADIAFISPGQPAMVKLTAYDFAIYGGLAGRVEDISADTIENQRGESFYTTGQVAESLLISPEWLKGCSDWQRSIVMEPVRPDGGGADG